MKGDGFDRFFKQLEQYMKTNDAIEEETKHLHNASQDAQFNKMRHALWCDALSRPFKCNLCNMTFVEEITLHRHYQRHIGIEKFLQTFPSDSAFHEEIKEPTYVSRFVSTASDLEVHRSFVNILKKRNDEVTKASISMANVQRTSSMIKTNMIRRVNVPAGSKQQAVRILSKPLAVQGRATSEIYSTSTSQSAGNVSKPRPHKLTFEQKALALKLKLSEIVKNTSSLSGASFVSSNSSAPIRTTIISRESSTLKNRPQIIRSPQTPQKEFKCYCGSTFGSKDDLTSHYETHLKESKSDPKTDSTNPETIISDNEFEKISKKRRSDAPCSPDATKRSRHSFVIEHATKRSDSGIFKRNSDIIDLSAMSDEESTSRTTNPKKRQLKKRSSKRVTLSHGVAVSESASEEKSETVLNKTCTNDSADIEIIECEIESPKRKSLTLMKGRRFVCAICCVEFKMKKLLQVHLKEEHPDDFAKEQAQDNYQKVDKAKPKSDLVETISQSKDKPGKANDKLEVNCPTAGSQSGNIVVTTTKQSENEAIESSNQSEGEEDKNRKSEVEITKQRGNITNAKGSSTPESDSISDCCVIEFDIKSKSSTESEDKSNLTVEETKEENVSERRNLRSRSNPKTQPKPDMHICSFCGKKFLVRSQLTKHTKRFHSLEKQADRAST